MKRLNQDAVVAMVLLVFCGVFFWASFDIRQPDYGVLLPSTWPRVILGVLSLLALIYLVQSLQRDADPSDSEARQPTGGWLAWLAYWRNPLWCFGLFLTYLLTLPVLGMLLGGIGFVFVLQCVLGGWAPRNLILHALVAICSVGGMWSLFTFGLGVMLPRGMIFSSFY